MQSNESISSLIKQKASQIGFEFSGFSKSERLSSEEHRLRDWLNAGFQGKMTYLENHFEKRLDPSEILPGCKSVISLMYNYYPENEVNKSKYNIAKYAYGKDYHKVVKKRLNKLCDYLVELFPDVKYRFFVDSAPVMERQWAEKSGLGWIGKNTLLINKTRGSYFFLAEILLTEELEYDSRIEDYCGKCTKCLDACPTRAFPEPYVLDASKCISYATIELKDEKIPELFKDKMEGYIFGCDICQDVCPWNRFSKPTQEEKFSKNNEMKAMEDSDWESLDEANFNLIFEGSAVKRAKFEGLKRNISFVKGD